jgi:hypothetical protein
MLVVVNLDCQRGLTKGGRSSLNVGNTIPYTVDTDGIKGGKEKSANLKILFPGHHDVSFYSLP